MAEQIALKLIGSEGQKLFHVAVRFDAFHAHRHTERVRHTDDEFDYLQIFHIAGERFLNKRIIELERICVNVLQIAQVRKSRTEIVDIDFNAERQKLCEYRLNFFIVDAAAFRYFEHDVFRIDFRTLKRNLHFADEVRLQNLHKGNIDAHIELGEQRIPRGTLRKRFYKYPPSNRHDEPAPFKDGDKLSRADRTEAFVFPAQKRFCIDNDFRQAAAFALTIG